MAQAYGLVIAGLEQLKDIETIPARIALAAQRAVNKTLDRARAGAAREARREVNFPARYLSGDRLRVAKRASGRDLEGIVRARTRPTSLARFVISGGLGRRGGVAVAVKPGGARAIPRAFLIKLRAGTAALDTKSNLGLAIRLRPGETLKNKRDKIRLSRNLYLLFGPSVSQVLLHETQGRQAGVFVDIEPEIADFLEQEFLRLLDLDHV